MTAPTQQQGTQLDLEQVTAQTVQQLGAQNAMLTYELNAQVAARAAVERTVTERDEQLGERDAELARVRQTASLLQQQIQQLEAELADARLATVVPEPVDHDQPQEAADQPADVAGDETPPSD